MSPRALLALLLLPLFNCGGELDVADETGEAAPVGLTADELTWPVVREGDNDRDSVTAEYLLRHHGGTLAVDGLFDDESERATRAFQARMGLGVDGVVGPATWRRLIVDVRLGHQNNAVRAVQDLLRNRYAVDVEVDGVMGGETRDAVVRFQKVRCLGQTGTVGLFTWNALVANRSYCNGGGGGGGSPAEKLLRYHDADLVVLWDQTFGRRDGADPLSNVRDAAAGRPARTSCYGTAPCDRVRLGGDLLDSMEKLRSRYGFRYFVTSIAGANHSARSFHYEGRAVDIGEVNGLTIFGDSSTSRRFMDACRALGAIEVFGPSNDPAGHNDHLHCTF